MRTEKVRLGSRVSVTSPNKRVVIGLVMHTGPIRKYGKSMAYLVVRGEHRWLKTISRRAKVLADPSFIGGHTVWASSKAMAASSRHKDGQSCFLMDSSLCSRGQRPICFRQLHVTQYHYDILAGTIAARGDETSRSRLKALDRILMMQTVRAKYDGNRAEIDEWSDSLEVDTATAV